MKRYSTPEVARMLGMHQPHLQRAISKGRVTAPPITNIAGLRVRLWSKADVERARKELGRGTTARKSAASRRRKR